MVVGLVGLASGQVNNGYMKGAGVCVTGRERSHALKGWLHFFGLSGTFLGTDCGFCKIPLEPKGTIRAARVRIGPAAAANARARQHRTPRQGSPPRAIAPHRGESHDKLRAICALRAK